MPECESYGNLQMTMEVIERLKILTAVQYLDKVMANVWADEAYFGLGMQVVCSGSVGCLSRR